MLRYRLRSVMERDCLSAAEGRWLAVRPVTVDRHFLRRRTIVRVLGTIDSLCGERRMLNSVPNVGVEM